MDQFIPGDIVRLKSGGPLMAVVEVEPDVPEGKVRCRWREPGQRMQDRVFDVAELEHPWD